MRAVTISPVTWEWLEHEIAWRIEASPDNRGGRPGRKFADLLAERLKPASSRRPKQNSKER